VYDNKNIPRKGGVIFACNHASHFDPAVAGCGTARLTQYLARETLFTAKASFGLLLVMLNCHSLRRGEQDRAAIKTAVNLLKRGYPVMLFPEGTRSEDGVIRDGQSGAAFLSAHSKCPIVPVYVHNTHKAMKKGSNKIERIPLSVSYGEPICTAYVSKNKNKHELYASTMDEVMSSIRSLQAARRQEESQ